MTQFLRGRSITVIALTVLGLPVCLVTEPLARGAMLGVSIALTSVVLVRLASLSRLLRASLALSVGGSAALALGLTGSDLVVLLAIVILLAFVVERPKALRLAAANLLVLAMLLCLTEVGYRVLAESAPTQTRPPAYSASPYWNSSFEAERASLIAAINDGTAIANRRSLTGSFRGPRDWSSRSFNVRDGRRVTTDVPSSPGYRIFVLGGSTVFGAEVPDGYTLTSYLQREINQLSGRYEVVNLGVSGASVGANVSQLQHQVRLQDGDIVVLYGGVNNVRGILDAGDRSTLLTRVMSWPSVGKLVRRSRLLQALDTWNRSSPWRKFSATNLREGLSEFRRDVESVERLARRGGARSLVVLQPNLLMDTSPEPDERQLLRVIAPAWHRAVRESYDGFRQWIDEQPDRRQDLSFLLDDVGPTVFLDWCHVSERGNEAVAARIAAKLIQAGYLVS